MPSAGPFGRAIKWSFVMTWGTQGGNAVTMLLLASLLGPDAFGLVTLANVYVLFMQLLLDPGLTPALVQRKELRKAHLDSAFWLVFGLSLVLFGSSLVLSRWWAAGSDAPELPQIIGWLSLRIPLHGLTVVQQGVLRREMDFKTLAVRANFGVLAGAVAGVTLALLGYGYWALVAQQLTESAVSLVLLWRLSHWRPGLEFSAKALRELSGFSAAVFLSNIGVFAYMRADAAIMGIFFGPAAVGIYRLAMRLMNLCSDVGTQAVNLVSLPEFSRHQHDPAALRRATLRSLHIAMVFTAALLGGLAAIGEDLFTILGPQWELAHQPLLVLCVLGFFQVISIISTVMLQGAGRPFLNSVLTWIWGGLALSAAFLIGVLLRDAAPLEQILGVCLAHAAFGVFLHLPVYAFLMNRICGITPGDLVAAVGPAALAALLAFATAEGLRSIGLVATLAPVFRLLLIGAAAGSALVVTLMLLDGRSRALAARIVQQLAAPGRPST